MHSLPDVFPYTYCQHADDYQDTYSFVPVYLNEGSQPPNWTELYTSQPSYATVTKRSLVTRVSVTASLAERNGVHPLRSLVTSVLSHFGPRTEVTEDRSGCRAANLGYWCLSGARRVLDLCIPMEVFTAAELFDGCEPSLTRSNQMVDFLT